MVPAWVARLCESGTARSGTSSKTDSPRGGAIAVATSLSLFAARIDADTPGCCATLTLFFRINCRRCRFPSTDACQTLTGLRASRRLNVRACLLLHFGLLCRTSTTRTAGPVTFCRNGSSRAIDPCFASPGLISLAGSFAQCQICYWHHRVEGFRQTSPVGAQFHAVQI